MRRKRVTAAGALAAGLLVLGVGCSRGEEGPILPPIETTEVVLGLLDDPSLRTVVVENEKLPVKYDLMMPCGSGSGDYGEMSSLEMMPPSEVRLRVPELPDGVELAFAVAIRRQSYVGEGSVEFRMELDGKEIWKRTLPCSPSIPEEDRKWWRDRLSLGDGGELVLRTRYEGTAKREPRVGFGMLDVVRPRRFARRPASADGENVVLILVDTLRADGLHLGGNPREVSPNLDALAARGTVFESAYSAAPWTVPSTATVLTGLTPAEHGLGFSASNFLAHGLFTIAEALQSEGWTTGGFSCNTLISQSRNFGQGFESFRDYRWKGAARMIDDVEQWIDEQRETKFFLYLHLIDPHGPYLPEEPWRSRFAPDVPADHEAHPNAVMDRFWEGEQFEPGYLEEYSGWNRKLYDAEIAWLDELLGRLFERLESQGSLDRTIVALTSDHGEEFLEHGLMGHVSQLHDELVHVPLVLAGPGVPKGKRIAQQVENRFVARTLLELAGVKARGNLEGIDLLDEKQLAASRDDPIFFSTRHGRIRLPGDEAWSSRRTLYGARWKSWHFLWAPPVEGEGDPIYRLYDIEKDPEEHEDVASSNPEVCADLRRRIQEWLARSEAKRPLVRMSGDADREEMEALGYIGDD